MMRNIFRRTGAPAAADAPTTHELDALEIHALRRDIAASYATGVVMTRDEW